MPIYEFECRKCKAHLEVFQKINDKPPAKCRKCGGRLEKLVSASAFQFKGTGWYVTDYASKGSKEKRSADKSADKGDPISSSSDSSEKKENSDKKDSSDKKETSPTKKTSDKASSPKTSKGD
jgi:putative FmdB family regulatory protein